MLGLYGACMYKNRLIAVILLFIAISISLQIVVAADGYWILDGVKRDCGGRDDVSTTWNDISDTSIAGKTSWQWPDMDCSQNIVTTFSWSGIPQTIQPGDQYNLTAAAEQIANSNCLSVGSDMMIYAGYPINDSDIRYYTMESVSDGPQVHLGTGDVLTRKYTSPIYGPYPYGPDDLDRDYAILIECYMYQEWYRIQYRYKWIERNMLPASDN
jgi:hypothetical protein